MWEIFTGVTALAVYGGLVSAFRAAYKAKKPFTEKVLDVLVGAVMAGAVGESFLLADSPKSALFVGLIAGSLGGYLLDAVQALSPTMAMGIIDGALAKFGYRRKEPASQPENEQGD
nr:MAG TPA: holin [Caudoviricetes sp.]